MQEVLTTLAALAVQAVPAARWCSAALGDPLQPWYLASGSSASQQLHGAQWHSGQGPCLDAYRQRAAVLCADLGTDARWPRLAAALSTTAASGAASGAVSGVGPGAGPVRSVLALPLLVGQEVVGTLELSSPHLHAFDQDGAHQAVAVGRLAAALIERQQLLEQAHGKVENLQVALSTRAPIEQAKGVLAVWLGCSTEQAYAVLRATSQENNVKVRQLAALVISDPGASDLLEVLGAQHQRLLAKHDECDSGHHGQREGRHHGRHHGQHHGQCDGADASAATTQGCAAAEV
ncbi:GAF and ANTAR domain-containing protein [Kineococcus sp. SYSU DK005]|uniref:GAF and ANTAR domain-containing protein n=1 Tax=Kineococcus sp. SYSU DK005 TaxID=3383126 RepID=UPI003D7E949E